MLSRVTYGGEGVLVRFLKLNFAALWLHRLSDLDAMSSTVQPVFDIFP